MYKPLGVERAILISAWGRRVIVGFSPELGDQVGVIDERKRGHSSIAFESVFRRIGRYVRCEYCPEGSTGVWVSC